jgi:X-X-X-Leu-X-X-Gly heptad repeat protein
MPFELRDFQDLVRLLREHPDWREELRALILTQELLTLPGLVRELAEGQQRLAETVAQLTAGLDQLTARVDRLTAGLDQLTATVAHLAEGQERQGERLDGLVVQRGEMRGWALEQRYRTYAPAYFGRFLRQVQLVHIGRLADALRERLGEGELAEVLLADIILTGRLPAPTGPSAIWVVLEVSATVDRRDVERAQRRAALLRQAHYPAVAVAAGPAATAGAYGAASELGVAVLLDGRIDGWQEALDHMLPEA